MLTVFLASLWDGCTEFALDRERLDQALAVLDAEAATSTRPTITGRPDRRPADAPAAAAAAARGADRPRRQLRGADRGDAQRGHGPRRLGAAVPRDRRAGRGGRQRRRGPAPACRADQHHAPLQGRRRRARPARLRADRRGTLAPDRHRRPGAALRRLPARRGRGGRAGRARRDARGPSRPRRRPGLGGARFEIGCERPARWKASATICWRCAPCSTARARSAPRCRCAPRR